MGGECNAAQSAIDRLLTTADARFKLKDLYPMAVNEEKLCVADLS